MTGSKNAKKNIDLSNLSADLKKELLEFLKLKSKFQELENEIETLGIQNVIQRIQNKFNIPVSIFNEKLSVLESLCKYLKENLNLSNKKISSLLNKSSKSVWQAYTNSKHKHHDKFVISIAPYFIPISIFRKRKSVLESLVVYLKEDLNLTYHEIALLLKRDDRTIWTVYNRRARKKNE